MFDVRPNVTDAVPMPTGVTVRVGVSPQLVNVTDDGLTVATAALELATETVSVVLPVRLQPDLPSPLRGVT